MKFKYHIYVFFTQTSGTYEYDYNGKSFTYVFLAATNPLRDPFGGGKDDLGNLVDGFLHLVQAGTHLHAGGDQGHAELH